MKHARSFTLLLFAVMVAIGCGGGKPQSASAISDTPTAEKPIQLAEAPANVQPAAGGSASIRGTVHFEGTPPAPEKIKMDADPVCQQQHTSPMYSEEVVVNDNKTLKNVFVYVKEGVKGPFPAPTTPATMTQMGCWYQPHVFGLQVDQPFDIVNADATLHNVNAKPTSNPPFNIAQPVKGMKSTKKFSKPEVMVTFKCNVHPWMHAFAGVLDHPFFSVTGTDGAFAISGLPAGTYTIAAWHEKYGTQTQTVTVGDGESTSVDVTFKSQ